MSVQHITLKTKELLTGLLLASLILLPATKGYAESVKIHSVIKGNRLQIVMDWPKKVTFKAMVDDVKASSKAEGHELLLSFDKAIETSDLETLTKKTSGWLESISRGYDTLLLQSRDKASFKVSREGKKIQIEVVRNLSAASGKLSKTAPDNDLLITFAEKVLENNRAELMRRIFDKHGDGFLMARPLLAAQLMLALNNKVSSERWVQMAENQPDMMLDQQIELVGLYGKLGQSGKIGQTNHTRNLGDRIEQRLNNPKLPPSRKKDLIYVMLELKAGERVLPHLRQLAYGQGAEWVFPYEETLTQLGKKKELLDFWRMRIKRSGLSVEDKRQLAFQFLDHNSKADAVPVFRELAQTASANSPDVEQLLFLWGPYPGKEERKWLTEKARASKDREQTEWLKHLVNVGEADEAVRLALKRPSAKITDELFAFYVSALQELQDKDMFASALDQWMEPETNPDRLYRYGNLAEDQSQIELANEAYEKLLEFRPQDKRTLRRLGRNYFYLNQWKNTQKYLGQLVTGKNNDWPTNYYYAEAMYLEGHVKESLPFFRRTLEIVQKISSSSTILDTAKAVSLERLGKKKEALVIYERLVKVSPKDKKIRLKYISCLMDVGEFEKAQKWLTLTKK